MKNKISKYWLDIQTVASSSFCKSKLRENWIVLLHTSIQIFGSIKSITLIESFVLSVLFVHQRKKTTLRVIFSARFISWDFTVALKL